MENTKKNLEPRPGIIASSRKYIEDQYVKVQTHGLLQRIFRQHTAQRWVFNFASPVILVLLLILIINNLILTARLSLPGDPLYTTKLLLEDIHLAFTFNPVEKTNLYIQLSRERTTEFVDLVLEGDYEMLPAPDCTGRSYSIGYPALPIKNGKMDSGLYCVYGDLDPASIGPSDGVTFYLVDGGFKINGNAVVKLSAPKTGATPMNGAIPGLLFFAPSSNNSGISLNGNATGYFKGTWLLPGMDISKWNGTFGGEFRGQLMVWNFNVRGTFAGGMWYDSDYLYTSPASIDLLH